MNGYVMNKSNTWRHAMKRSIGPGHKVPLTELFEQYGKKHDLKPNEEFVNWLRTVKLSDTNTWDVVYEPNNAQAVDFTPEVKLNSNQALDNTSKKELKPDDIAMMTVREAREKLKTITDLKLLQYAYEEARTLAHKDSLCRLLKKRIQEIEITRR